MERHGKLVVLNPRGRPTGIFGRRLDAHSKPSDILDPVAQPSGDPKPISLAPRLAALNGKNLYLVDTGFAGSYEFMQEMQDWFHANMPTVKTHIRRKGGTMFTDDPELWAKIKSEGGDAVVLGVGG